MEDCLPGLNGSRALLHVAGVSSREPGDVQDLPLNTEVLTVLETEWNSSRVILRHVTVSRQQTTLTTLLNGWIWSIPLST